MVMVVTIFSSVSTAQNRRLSRWGGEWFSDGYHRGNPGPNSDYYNPYTAHNSLLISENPEAAYHVYPNGYRASGIRMGIPFSVYASPTRGKTDSTPAPVPDHLNSQPMDNTSPDLQPKLEKPGKVGEIINDSALIPLRKKADRSSAINPPFSNSSFQSQSTAAIEEKGPELVGPFTDKN